MTAPRSGRARLPRRRGLRLVQFPPPLLLLLLLAAAGPARGWESGDLELFDLVEEVQLNFYQFLGVQQVSPAAGPPEGGAAGRKRAAPDAEEGAGRARPGFLRGSGHCGPDVAILGPGCARQPGPRRGLLVPSASDGVVRLPRARPLRPAPLLKWRSQCQAGPCHQPGVAMPSLSSAVLGEEPSTQLYWRKEEEWCVGNGPVSKFSPSQLHLNLTVILAASFLCLSGKIGMHFGWRVCCRSFSRAVL